MLQHPEFLQATGPTPIVRNTFINYDTKQQHGSAKRRNKSLPPLFRLGDERNELLEISCVIVDSDDSTDVRTEAGSDDTPSSDMGNHSSYAPSSSHGHAGPCEPCAPVTYLSSGPQGYTWMQPPQIAPVALSSKASAYEPKQQPIQPLSQNDVDSHAGVAEMVEAAKQILQRSPEIATADLTQSLDGWSLVVTPAKNSNAGGTHVLALAKRALFEAAEKSKSVYVLGYNSPAVAFATKAQGFESRLGVMASPHRACWRSFKQGSCHHGATCCKEHPILEVPVRVFLEAAQFQLTANEQVVKHCNQEFASFLMMIISWLTNTSGLPVSLFDLGGEGWSIEIPILDEHSNLREHLLALARSAFTEASRKSKNVFLMGFGAKPFIPKPNGFVAMLGEMADSNWACWDVYKEGVCAREGACRWQHPQCLMPVSLVLKPVESPKVNAMVDSIAAQMDPVVDPFVAEVDSVQEASQEQ